MKICLLSAANNVHTMRWANAMNGRGHDVTVISCNDHRPSVNIAYDDGVKLLFLKHASGFGYYLNACQLKRIVKKEKFDVVNVHYASGYGTLGRRAKLKNALLNIWGSDVYLYPYKNKFNAVVIKKNLKFYKYVASTSNCMAEQARRFVDRTYFITPFGVDAELFKPLSGIRDESKFTVGTVKTLLPVYGISDSIKAFGEVVRRLKSEGSDNIVRNLRYEIYGRGEQRDQLQKLIDESGLSDKVKLCGYVENGKLPEIYNRFDIFACNSLSESFGVAAVEAMACGIPVQVSDAEGFVEVLDESDAGFIAKKGNIDEIADNTLKLLKDKELRVRMGIAGRERVKQVYDWKDNVGEMEKLYRKIFEEAKEK